MEYKSWVNESITPVEYERFAVNLKLSLERRFNSMLIDIEVGTFGKLELTPARNYIISWRCSKYLMSEKNIL